LKTSRTFRHRARIERDVSTGSQDPFGNHPPSDWQPLHDDLRCRYYVQARTGAREIADADKTAVVVGAKMIIPSGTDVTEADRVIEVRDSDEVGTVLTSRPHNIQAVILRRDHLELILKEIR
jgi:hypothetical protein